MTTFCWPPTAAGSGSSGNTSSGLETTGAPVDVSGAAPPVAGQVLTAIDASHAAWRVPGLKYDAAIRFNVNALSTATIEPGTWGFVYTTPVGSSEIEIFVVSSLAAPPVDSRFGLYVSPSVTLPVTVSLIGASQIMGLDGTLSTSISLPPGGMYEWVFYHEGGVAIWGLVSSTAPHTRPWLDFSSSADPSDGQWVIGNGDAITLPNATAAGMHCAVLVLVADPNVSITCATNGFQIGRISYNTGANVSIRAGGWYEWVSVDAGESFRWLAVTSGNDAKPPLERSTTIVSADPPPNQWILSSDASGVAHTPTNPVPGDSFAIFVNTSSAVIVPQTGQSITSPDGMSTIVAPATLSVSGVGYYEWIWAPNSIWYPRQKNVVGSLYPRTNDFRLTTQSGNSLPVDGTYSSIVMVSHAGNRIALYDGTTWIDHQPPNATLNLSGMSAGIPQDIFASSGGDRTTVTLTKVAWTNATTRTTVLQLVNGVWCRAGALTQRYLGTILADSATTFTFRAAGSGATKAVCGVWNQDNRIKTCFTWSPTFASASPSAGSTWEPLGGVAAPHIELVTGQSVDDIEAHAIVAVDPGAVAAIVGIGIDSTTTPSGFRHSVTTSGIQAGIARASQKPAVGRKTVNLLQYGSTTAPVFYGASGVTQSGLTADVWH